MPQLIDSHIFMSYSRKDEEVMRRVVAFLRKKELKVWVDNENLIPGTPVWEEEIENAIKRAYAVVAILSPDSESSEWVRREITYSDRYLKRVFPILVRGDEDSSIPIRLITRQFVDIRSNEEAGLNSLSTAIAFYAEEMEARERKAREEAEKLARAQAEREAAERESARLKAEREAAELAAHVAAEKAAKEKAEEEAARERAAREKAADEKAEREKVEREVIKKSEHEAKEKETRSRAEKRRQRYLELLNKTIHAIKLYYRRILLITIAVTLIVLASIFALSLPLSASTSTPHPTLLLSSSTPIPRPTATSLLLSILSSPPSPMKTRIPTALPTYTITPLPIVMKLYDDFNNKGYDGNYESYHFDSKKWAFGPDPGVTTIQQHGVLRLAVDTGVCPATSCSGGITVVGGTTIMAERTLSLTNAIEAKMSLANEFSGSFFSGFLKVYAVLPYYWHYICIMGESSSETYFECSSSTGTHTSKRIPITLNQYYTVLIEVDPSTATFRSYLNNQLVDIYEPFNAADLKKSKFIFLVLIGANSNTTGSALVDEIRLGKPATP